MSPVEMFVTRIKIYVTCWNVCDQDQDFCSVEIVPLPF